MNLEYEFEFSNEAKKYLKKLDKKTAMRIVNALEGIRPTPTYHQNVKKMIGYEGEIYRLRVGNLRILYELIDNRLVIFVFRIGSRGDIYK